MRLHAVILLLGWLGEQGTGGGVAAQNLQDLEDSNYFKQSCEMPEQPENGNYKLLAPKRCLDSSSRWGECKNAPGQKVPHMQKLSVTCKHGYQLRGYNTDNLIISCNNGHWSKIYSVCENYLICNPLTSLTVDVNCTYEGKEVSCDSFVPAGTMATPKCRKHFKRPEYSEETTLECLENGEWSHPLEECDPPECGVALPPPVSFSDNQQGGYPWSASIFTEQSDGSWLLAGLGTLITPLIVLTGPITYGGNKQRMKVGLGPYNQDNYRAFIDVPEDVSSPSYPENRSDKSSMQLILLADRVNVSARLMPACVDWDNSHTIPKGTTGHVVSWGNDNNLLSYKMKYLDSPSCQVRLKQENIAYDDVCVFEDKNNLKELETLKLSTKDIGGSLTVVEDGKHFLVGLLNDHVLEEDGSTFVFTSVKVPEKLSWIKNRIPILENYSFGQTNQPGPVESNTLDVLRIGIGESVSSNRPCELPDPPQNGNYSLCLASTGDDAQCWIAPRQSVPNSQNVYFSCDPGYQLLGLSKAATISCDSGQWSRTFPQCIKCGVPLPQDASSGQRGFPWSASIFRQDNGGTWRSYCLGTLITPNIVLSDTRCVVEPSDQWTKVGLGVKSKTLEGHDFVTDVKESVYRKIHTGDRFLMDLALLRLAESVEITDTIMPACVDWGKTLKVSASSNLHVSAWIKDRDLVTGKGKFIHWSYCKHQLLVTKTYTLDKDTFCALISGIGGTPGNESYGAGTTVVKNGKHYVVGVFSHDAGRTVNAYTSVTTIDNVDWITDNLGNTIDQTTKNDQPPELTPLSASDSDPNETLVGSCVVPETPQNANYSSEPSSQHISISCDPGYQLLGLSKSATVTCNIDQWSQPFPECIKCGIPLSKKAASSGQQGFPWSASVFRQEKGTGPWRSYCLGTLITTNIVLTGTRCVVDPDNQWTKVGLGVKSKTLEGHEIVIDVTESMYRQIYSGEKFLMDLALLRLAQNVKITDNIMPACVDWDNTIAVSSSSNLHVSRWIKGRDLLTGNGKYIQWSFCKHQLLVTKTYTLDNDTFCALINTVDSTPEIDSYGAGTTVLKDGQHFVVGVFSHNAGRAVNAYTTLTSANNMEWVVDKIGFNIVETTEAPPAATTESAVIISDLKASPGSCVLPEPPLNSNYSLCSPPGGAECYAAPRQTVPNSQNITLSCNPGYELLAPTKAATVTCKSSRWNQPFPECIKCGIPLPQNSDTSTQQGFPWSASVFRQDKGGTWRSICLGTLITPEAVLTDTRCIVDPNDQWTKVGLGVNSKTFDGHEVIKDVKESVYREIYTGEKFLMEIAILRLLTGVEFTDFVMPACIHWDNSLKLSPTSELHVSAWVREETLVNGKGKYVPWNVCKQQELVTQSFTVDKDTFCVDTFGSGPTPSTSSFGAGTTIVENGKHYLVGVFSHDARRAVNVYSSVISPYNIDWLIDKLGYTFGQTIMLPPVGVAVRPPVSDPCTVPDPLDHRVFLQYPCQGTVTCNMSANDLVSTGELVSISCVPGYNLVQGLSSVVSKVFSACQHGVWDPKLPECYKLCPPLLSETLDLECKQGLNPVRCDKPILPETIVTYKCKPYHTSGERYQKHIVKCSAAGEWSRELPRCIPTCGVSNLNSAVLQPAIVGGNFSRPGNFPWHTAIFHKEKESWANKCGGTLISTRHVLTASHCVTSRCLSCKSPVKKASDVMVAFGKNFREWDVPEDTEVKSRVKEIFIHPYYVGETINFINDIALIVLEAPVTLTSYVLPACVDYNMRHLEKLRTDRTLQGYVAGWGSTEECTPQAQVCDATSNVLKYVQTTIIDFDECFNTTQHIKTFSQSRLTPDKFCSGNGSVSVVQQGDSGGGLTFLFDGIHHIYGIVSVKLKLELADKFYYNFGAFSNVSYHIDWLNSIID